MPYTSRRTYEYLFLRQSMANFTDDIPEARRETLIASTEPASVKSSFNIAPWIVLVLIVFGLGGASAWWLRPTTLLTDTSTSTEPAASSAVAAQSAPPDSSNPEPSDVSDTGTSNISEAGAAAGLLGHRPYPIADASSLVAISTNPMVRLKPEVAQTVETMMAEAKALGISLDVISGFRSLEDQQYLFFDLKAERGQNAQTRAEVSAPPGYSEHHTGYAVDFVDTSQPATELNASFESTQAFRWLKENAAYYGFEMSFPKDNDQNVAYEPWHWRYVGNQESLELFYQD